MTPFVGDQSLFLEAQLFRQADGELKNWADYEQLLRAFFLKYCSIRQTFRTDKNMQSFFFQTETSYKISDLFYFK